jgi:hypothetical protein
MTADERRYVTAALEHGCIVCKLHHGAVTPAEWHHVTAGGRRLGHQQGFALCPMHHRGVNLAPGEVPRHSPNGGQGGRNAFERKYQPEAVLVQITQQLVAGGGLFESV